MRGFLKSVGMPFLAMVFVVTLNAQGDLPPSPASSPKKTTSAAVSLTDSLPSGPASSEGLPNGFALYEDEKSRFTIGIPSDWIAIDLPPFPDEQDPPISRTRFSQTPNAKDNLWQRVVDIRYGVTQSFQLVASEAKDGMSCSGFSEKARAEVFKTAQELADFGKGAKILESLRSEPILVAGCKGIRIHGSGNAPEEEPSEKDIIWTIEVRAVSNGKTLFFFFTRPIAENFKKNAEMLQRSVATFKLPAAK